MLDDVREIIYYWQKTLRIHRFENNNSTNKLRILLYLSGKGVDMYWQRNEINDLEDLTENMHFVFEMESLWNEEKKKKKKKKKVMVDDKERKIQKHEE